MNVAEVLDRAADLIEERGWSRGVAHGANGSLCAQSAIATAILGDRLYTRSMTEDELALSREAGKVMMFKAMTWPTPIPAWNDRQRSAKPIIATLRKGAEKAREES